MKNKLARLMQENLRLSRQRWFRILDKQQLQALRILTDRYRFAVALGDIFFLEGRWYVSHAGLLRLSQRRHCAAIRVQQVREFCDPAADRWVFKATLYKRAGSQGFVGFGDANPNNVSPTVRGAELRVAETRAVNRALRKAYGIGICSVEELGALSGSSTPVINSERTAKPQPTNGANNGQPRLKDKLCLLVRQHNLDPTLVKAYAAHFCGTQSLSGASRELVEAFITHLEKEARENRNSLLCKLNSFSHPLEVRS